MANLTTKEQVKIYLNLMSNDIANDNIIEHFVSSSSAKINKYLNGAISQGVADYNFIVATAIESKTLPFQNINSVVKVEYKNSITDPLTEIDSSEYILSENPYKIFLKGGFLANVYYKITLDVGYEFIPPDIEQATIELASSMYKDSDLQGGVTQGRLGISNIAVGNQGGSSTYTFSSVWEKVKEDLKGYRIYTYGVK